jgi:DNA-directed RNA polymerase specialized sigma24 family protein
LRKRPLFPRRPGVGRDIVAWYHELFDPLQAYISKHVHSAKDAEEIAQEAFLHLWLARSSGPIANPRRFLFATASNLLKDDYHLAHAQATHTDASVEDVETPDPDRSG